MRWGPFDSEVGFEWKPGSEGFMTHEEKVLSTDSAYLNMKTSAFLQGG
jgi:hypothetical protein